MQLLISLHTDGHLLVHLSMFCYIYLFFIYLFTAFSPPCELLLSYLDMIDDSTLNDIMANVAAFFDMEMRK